MTRYCPCGHPIERKPGEGKAAFENRKHCNSDHRYLYHKPAPPKKAFGLAIPQNKVQRRIGVGLLHYLYNRPV